jgi:probable addiction module antidote protein
MRRNKSMRTVTKTKKPAKTARAAKAIKPTKAEKKVTFSKWDPAEIITTKERVIAFLEEALEENDPVFLLETIGHIARSKGMAQIARELNLNREGLYTALSPQGNPSFITIARVLDNLGYQLSVRQKISA